MNKTINFQHRKIALIAVVVALFSSCQQSAKTVTRDNTKIKAETLSLLSFYAKSRFGTDSVKIHKRAGWNLDEECVARAIDSTDIGLSALEIGKLSKEDTTSWTKHTIPKLSILITEDMYNYVQSLALKRDAKNGFLVYSHPVFSKNFEFAIMRINYACGPKCGDGEVTLFVKKNNKWSILKTICKSIT